MTDLDGNAAIADIGRMENDETPRRDAVDVKSLVIAIVRALVDQPEEVFVTEIEGTQSCVLELRVARGDVGKVIGRKGIHADALRRIVHAIGGKNRKRYVLEILEEKDLT